MQLPLFYYGSQILRQKAKPVVEVNDAIRELIRNMEETMESFSAIGISAPQVGSPLAVCLTRHPVEDEFGNYDRAPTRVFINPKLFNPSQETWMHDEGCLSIPKIYEDVERPVRITVTALDQDGKEFTEELVGWAARVLMHENDHLNGVLFIDRISQKRRHQIEADLRRIKNRHSRN